MAALTTKSKYGLAALFYMSKEPTKTFQIKEIADNANIPQKYLEQLLVQLKKEGIVTSIRGAGGGYKFAKSPDEITLFDIFSILEGDLCDSDSKTGNPALDLFWADMTQRMKSAFELPLSELKQYEKKANEIFSYVI